MSNGYSTRSEDRKTYVPTLSLSCTGDMVVPSSFAPRLIAMVRAVPTMCCDRMSMGSPWLAPSAVVRLQSRVFSMTMVHSCGRPAKELVAAKRPMRCPRQRERQLEAQVKDLQQQLAKPAPAAAGQGEAETVVVDDVEMDTAESEVNALRSQIKDLKADLVWANSLDPRRQNLLAGGLEGTLLLCSSNSTQQWSSSRAAKLLRNAWPPCSNVRLSASKLRKPQLILPRAPNSLWSWPPRRRRRQSKRYTLPRMSWPRLLQRLERWQRSEPMGLFRLHHWQTLATMPLPVSFARTMLRDCGWKESRISSPSSPRQWPLHSPGSRANPPLPRRRLPRTMRRSSQSSRVLTSLRTMIPLGRSWTRVSGRRLSTEKGLRWPASSRPPSSNGWSELSPPFKIARKQLHDS